MTDFCTNCGQTSLVSLYDAPAFDSGPPQLNQLFGLARCSACNLVNTTGVKPDTVAQAYTGEYYGSATSKFLGAIEHTLALLTATRAKKIIRLWRKVQQTRRYPSVLDIGCGRGQLLHAFQSLGASVLGLERKEFPAGEAASDIVRVGSISDPEYADTRFDIIILWHVLEHMVEHEKLLNDITNCLNNNGLLIIAVPNFSSLQQRIFSKHWFHLDLPRHLVHFDSEWLVQELSSRGYGIEVTRHTDLAQNTYGFIQSAFNLIAPKRPNAYYKLLKHSRHRMDKSAFAILSWSLLSIILLPFAVLEGVLGSLLNKGATVQIVARLERAK